MKNNGNKKIIIYLITIFFFFVIIYFGTTNSYADITPYSLSDVEGNWDKENMESQRIELIEKGASLIGKTDHYGGLNNYELVENPQYLSCSGLVSWCFKFSSTKRNKWQSTDEFINASDFKNISKSELIPGDIVVNTTASNRHMGIFAGKSSNGKLVWLHCTAHYGGDVGKTKGVILSTEPRFEKEGECVYRRYKNFDDSQGSGSSNGGAGSKFVKVYNAHQEIQDYLNPKLLFEALESNAKTSKMVDLTKYLLYKATGNDYGVIKPEEVFAQYKNNEFKEVKQKNKGSIGWAFIRAWENNELRKYMEGDDSYDYDSTPNINLCVTADKQQYILHDEIGQSKGNKIFGIEVKSYENEVGKTWQNVALFKEYGINIKDSEYSIYGESKINVDIIEEISIKQWEEMAERIDTIAQVKGVELESNQRDCLIDIYYTSGKKSTDIYKILDLYKNDGLNEREFKQMQAFQGARGEARWTLFSEGKYFTPIAGEELDPSNYSSSGGGDILEVAEECWQWVCKNNPSYGATSIPPGGQIDCSGFVSWVLHEMGYTEFSCQHTTQWFVDNKEHIKSTYGWEIIDISAGQNISDIVQAGDIIDRSVGSGANGHMNIAVSCENGVLMGYDCGTNGLKKAATCNGEPIDVTYFLTNARPGIIIRGVNYPK